MWGDAKRVAARGLDALLDGRNVRSAEQMRGEFGDAVSRQGTDRDALVDAIMGYGQRKTAAADRAVPYEDMIRAIMAGGGLALAPP
jgi:hypothetical protein